MKSMETFRLVMADEPELEKYLRRELEWQFSNGPVNLCVVRDYVSSPRLMSFGVKAFSHSGLVLAGDSYLSLGPILADGVHKTFALHIDEWRSISEQVEKIQECNFRDQSVMKLQVWAVDPRRLDEFAMAIAVAMSYKGAELMSESRISSALDDLFARWGYYSDEF